MSRTGKVLGMVAVLVISAMMAVGCGSGDDDADGNGDSSELLNNTDEAWVLCQFEMWNGERDEYCEGFVLRPNNIFVDVVRVGEEWYGCQMNNITWGTRGNELVIYYDRAEMNAGEYTLSGNSLTVRWGSEQRNNRYTRRNVGNLTMSCGT